MLNIFAIKPEETLAKVENQTFNSCWDFTSQLLPNFSGSQSRKKKGKSIGIPPKAIRATQWQNYTILVHWKMTKVPITANSKTSLESHSVNRRGNESRIAFPRLYLPFFLSDMLSDKEGENRCESSRELWVLSKVCHFSTRLFLSWSLWISWKKSTPTEKKENEGIIIKRYMRFCTQQTTISQDEECAQSQQILQLFSLENFHPKSIHSSLWWTSSSSSQKSKERENTPKKNEKCPILTGNYSCLKVNLIFTRDRSFYFTTVFIPGKFFNPTKLLTLFISSAWYDWITWKTTTKKEKKERARIRL